MITSGQTIETTWKKVAGKHMELFDKILGKSIMKIEMNAQLIG